jgi:glycosyltransferase involved in cell wall biosynthesis
MQSINILMIGADLTSNGGIASVIKCYYHEWQKDKDAFDIILLKTNYYKDKKLIFEIFIFFKAFFMAWVILTTKKINIVHIHSSSGIGFFREAIFVVLSKIFSKKVIFHIHASRFNEFFTCRNKFLKIYIHQILKISDLILTLCYDWEGKLKNYYSKIKVQTLHNPVTIENKSYIIKPKKDTKLQVLFLGFLIRTKGLYDILEIAKKCYDNNIDDVLFKIAGKGDLEHEMINYINENRLNEIVEYAGWVTGKRKIELLENSDILFLPSYNEGMPICILEAMSNYLPIISTRISGIPDLVINNFNGYLCDPGEIEKFFNILLKIKNNKQLIEKLGNNSYEHVKHFGSDRVFNKLKQIYYDTISKTD